ncbi:uncharacterized protein LOC118149217 isoform X1 [Callithrix jacchus]
MRRGWSEKNNGEGQVQPESAGGRAPRPEARFCQASQAFSSLSRAFSSLPGVLQASPGRSPGLSGVLQPPGCSSASRAFSRPLPGVLQPFPGVLQASRAFSSLSGVLQASPGRSPGLSGVLQPPGCSSASRAFSRPLPGVLQPFPGVLQASPRRSAAFPGCSPGLSRVFSSLSCVLPSQAAGETPLLMIGDVFNSSELERIEDQLSLSFWKKRKEGTIDPRQQRETAGQGKCSIMFPLMYIQLDMHFDTERHLSCFFPTSCFYERCHMYLFA